ncbi:MAG: lipase secretion chaperone [Duganella sp.]
MASRYLWGAAALAAMVALVALVAGIGLLTTPAHEKPSPAADTSRSQAAAGEARRVPVAAPPATATALSAAPTTSIALDDKQSLIADHALRAVFEHYLLGKREGAHDAASRLTALHAYLQRQLPPNAALNARQLASNYSAYLSAHDSLLAAQHFSSTPDLNRLASWQQQRHQLRLRMLGEQVTHEWFGTEDTYLTEAIRQAMLARDGALPAPDSEEEVLHRQHMAQVLREAVGEG